VNSDVPPREKSAAVKSGDRGGQEASTARPLHALRMSISLSRLTDTYPSAV
jgi:hypothetical protein